MTPALPQCPRLCSTTASAGTWGSALRFINKPEFVVGLLLTAQVLLGCVPTQQQECKFRETSGIFERFCTGKGRQVFVKQAGRMTIPFPPPALGISPLPPAPSPFGRD